VVVVSAGNKGRDNSVGTSGYGTITAPGNDPLVITVGAMKDMRTLSRNDDYIASYSSKGPTSIDHVVKPDLVAPGNRIISLKESDSYFAKTYPDNSIANQYYQTNNGKALSKDYFTLSGTSMASPMVAGTAALLLQKDPSLTPDTVKARLMKTATKTFPAYSIVTDPVTGQLYTSQYDIFTVGAGYLDAWAALNNQDTAAGTAASPADRRRTVGWLNGTAGKETSLPTRVLIAEDEAIIRLDLRETLEEEGYEIVGETGRGDEAVELARRLRPDLAILDIKMPGMDGLDAARAISEERLCGVLVLTAFSQRDFIEQARDAGALAYLVKPFQKSDLVPAIELAIGRFKEMSALAEEVRGLSEQLETRKVVDRAKGILMDRHGLSEQDAFSFIQKRAMAERTKMKAVAEQVVSGQLSP